MGALTTLADRSVAKLTEEEIIRRVVQSLADAAPAFPEGPGGDCAHLPTTGGRSIRASTIDSVILGRHFDAACDGIRAGAKLVNRNLSDLAAAGATPSDALLSLVIGPDVDATWLTDFAHGAGRAAAKAGCGDAPDSRASKSSEPQLLAAATAVGMERGAITPPPRALAPGPQVRRPPSRSRGLPAPAPGPCRRCGGCDPPPSHAHNRG